ncbi:MAG TPA: hypothetical protein VGL82_22050, partial [Bryobacteraceae bacterium]
MAKALAKRDRAPVPPKDSAAVPKRRGIHYITDHPKLGLFVALIALAVAAPDYPLLWRPCLFVAWVVASLLVYDLFSDYKYQKGYAVSASLAIGLIIYAVGNEPTLPVIIFREPPDISIYHKLKI